MYFGSYEYFKLVSQQNEFLASHRNIAHLAGGLFAELIACILFVPIDVVKERRQVQSDMKFTYKSDRDAIKVILNSEGVRGLYKAYAATVLSFGPFSALYFMFYEKLKKYCEYYNSFRKVMKFNSEKCADFKKAKEQYL